MAIKLKKGSESVIVGFNNSSEPLGKRDDLHLLIADAKASNDTHILSMFEEVPDEVELLDIKGLEFEKKQAAKKMISPDTKSSESE